MKNVMLIIQHDWSLQNLINSNSTKKWRNQVHIFESKFSCPMIASNEVTG